jgi:hypothetical protein
MKRLAPLLILALAACQGSPVSSPDPEIPTATLKRSAACTPEILGDVGIGHVQTRFVGSRWVWDLTITFFTTQCASDVNVKVYFIYPGEPLGQGFLDGRLQPIGAADAPAIPCSRYPEYTAHQAKVRWIVPVGFEWPDTFYDPHWYVEGRSGGTPIGSFRVRENYGLPNGCEN